jgi:hypothetical protein
MKRLYSLRKLLFLLLFSVLFFASCNKNSDDFDPFDYVENYSNDLLIDWGNLYLEIERYAPGYRPPISARTLGYIGFTIYESVVEGTRRNRSLAYLYPGLQVPGINYSEVYHWPTVVNAAYARSMNLYFPHIGSEFRNAIQQLEEERNLEYLKEIDNDVFERSRLHGRAVAMSVYQYSSTDLAGHEAFYNATPSNYNPPSGANAWQPTPPEYSPALLPYWGNVRTFALKGNERLVNPPLAYSETPGSPYFFQVLEVYNWVNNMDQESRWIAEFWSDDNAELTFTPAARFLAIAVQLLEERRLNLAETTEMYAKLGMALSDCGVGIWNSKYFFNLERPVTPINRILNPNWRTICYNPLQGYVGKSPNFPAYPSGHAGFGAAGGSILAEYFGMNHAFTDRCHEGRTEFLGEPRSFTGFRQMWEENAYSRIPLGVHYRMDCDAGIEMGLRAADRILALPWK